MRIKSEEVNEFANPDTAVDIDVKVIETGKIAQLSGTPAPEENRTSKKDKKSAKRNASAAPEQKEERRFLRQTAMKSADLAKRNRNALLALIRAHPEMARQLFAQRRKNSFSAA